MPGKHLRRTNLSTCWKRKWQVHCRESMWISRVIQFSIDVSRFHHRLWYPCHFHNHARAFGSPKPECDGNSLVTRDHSRQVDTCFQSYSIDSVFTTQMVIDSRKDGNQHIQRQVDGNGIFTKCKSPRLARLLASSTRLIHLSFSVVGW